MAACRVRGHSLTNVFRQVPVVNSPHPDFSHASMPHPRLVAISILCLIAVARSSTAAQTIPSPYTFIEHSQTWAVFGGKSDANPGQLGLGAQDANTYGGRYAVAFGGAISLDIDGTMFFATRDVLDVSRPVDDRSLGNTDFNLVLFDVKLRINLTGQRAWHGLQPFIAFGGGLAIPTLTSRVLELDSDMPGDEWYEFGKRFTGTLAGGVNFHIYDKISLRVDGVMNLWKITTPLGWRTVANDPLGENPAGEWVSVKTIRVGVAWRF